jgi:hypothetical protein
MARVANVDRKLVRNKVKPQNPNANGLRVQVDTKAIHDRLFVKLDQGDGTKMTSEQKLERKAERKVKRKVIVPPKPVEMPKPRLITIPKLYEEMTFVE